MEYVKNCWYVVGWSSHFADEIVERRVMGMDIILYRTSDGNVVAMEDLCPHKFMPLSKGKKIGDAIQCGYHGLTFGCDGGCIRIPGQDHIPSSIRVRTYPIQERHNVVWIWMGDPELEDKSKLFDLPQFTDPNWAAHQGEGLYLEANFMNVADNLCDPAHVSFVHPTTLGNAASEDIPVDMSQEGDVIITSRWIRDAPPIGFFQNFGGFSGNVDRWHYYYLHTPNVAVIDFGSADVEQNLQPENRNDGVRVFALHFMTPIDENTTIDWWMHLRNTALTL